MNSSEITRLLNDTVDLLSQTSTMKGLCRRHRHGDPLPSGQVLAEVIDLCRAVLFPGYYGKSVVNADTVLYTIGVSVERLFFLLRHQIEAGLCFENDDDSDQAHADMHLRARSMAAELIRRLPGIRAVLSTDVEAAYLGDPAAGSFGEVISCYPVIKALTNYRVAHELYLIGVPLLPRILTEMAHSETGIDIHPAAQIGKYFTIDHGTGVVIGATSIIGDNVKLYQGVTLGARSFPLDENGNPIKNIPRHPILEDDVIVYSNASILGRIRIGKGAVIGGNIWVTEDVPPGARIQQHRNSPKQN